MIVRLATLTDLNDCLAMDHGCFTDHVRQMQVQETESEFTVSFPMVRLPRRMQVRYPRDVEQLIDDWQQGEGFLVAEVDGAIRGYVDVLVRPWEHAAWVANAAVAPNYRRQGIGTALMRHAESWAREQGLETLLAETTTKNYPALCFYQKLGFKLCGFHDQYYANQDIALFFGKPVR